MKRFFGGFAAVLAVMCCENGQSACSGAEPKVQTVRIVPRRPSDDGTQVVSNTINTGVSGAPTVRVSTGNNNPKYIGKTPTIDVAVRNTADDEVVQNHAGNGVTGRSGGQAQPQQIYVQRQDYFMAEPDYKQQDYMRPMLYQPGRQRSYSGQQTSYYPVNSVPPKMNPTVVRYNTGSYQQTIPQSSNATTGQKVVEIDESSISKAYLYNKYGYGYVGMHLDLNLLNWRNTYEAIPVAANDMFDHDDYKFKPVIGGHFVAGYRFSPGWRADVEGGFTSEYSDSDNGITFKLSVPYVTANIYHDFVNGLYIGAGAGAAFPTISMEWENFTANGSRKTASSFTGAFMVGYSYYLSKSLILDFRGRFSGFRGPTLKRGVTDHYIQIGDDEVPLESLETKVGFMRDYSVSLGIKFEF